MKTLNTDDVVLWSKKYSIRLQKEIKALAAYLTDDVVKKLESFPDSDFVKDSEKSLDKGKSKTTDNVPSSTMKEITQPQINTLFHQIKLDVDPIFKNNIVKIDDIKKITEKAISDLNNTLKKIKNFTTEERKITVTTTENISNNYKNKVELISVTNYVSTKLLEIVLAIGYAAGIVDGARKNENFTAEKGLFKSIEKFINDINLKVEEAKNLAESLYNTLNGSGYFFQYLKNTSLNSIGLEIIEQFKKIYLIFKTKYKKDIVVFKTLVEQNNYILKKYKIDNSERILNYRPGDELLTNSKGIVNTLELRSFPDKVWRAETLIRISNDFRKSGSTDTKGEFYELRKELDSLIEKFAKILNNEDVKEKKTGVIMFINDFQSLLQKYVKNAGFLSKHGKNSRVKTITEILMPKLKEASVELSSIEEGKLKFDKLFEYNKIKFI